MTYKTKALRLYAMILGNYTHNNHKYEILYSQLYNII